MDRSQSSMSLGSALRKVESYQYPNTHLGHLTQEQRDSLETFKSICKEQGYYKPATGDHGPSHDDETLLRYLRARKFEPNDAFGQFKDTEDWRKENEIDHLYETIDIEEYEATRKLYPQWTGRRDKRGIPLYVFEVAPLNSKRMAEYDKSMDTAKGTAKVSAKLLRLFALYENLIRFTMPLCSAVPSRPYPETPVSQSNNLVDISGVGLKQFWNLRQHMQDASQLATAHYPETLDRIFVIGAPSFFPTVWSWIKGWFDPITVSKIFILSKSNMQSTLTQYIDPANIPRKYGGTLDWKWGELPDLEPAIADALHWQNPVKNAQGNNGFPSGPVKFRETESGDMVAHALGSLNGKQRDEVIATLPIDSQVNLGPTMSAEHSGPATQATTPGPAAYTPADLPIPSSGLHTHPHDSQEYFPTTGMTPPEEHEDRSMHESVPSSFGQEPAATKGPELSVKTEETSRSSRDGTSYTRLEEQRPTHASGQLEDISPAIVRHGHGDTTYTMEPSTVGQANKNVDVPEATSNQGETETKGVIQQARDMAENMYNVTASAVSDVSNTVLSAAGYGDEESKNATDQSLSQKTESLSVEDGQPAKQEDPVVDEMEKAKIEEFIRDKYSTHAPAAEKKH